MKRKLILIASIFAAFSVSAQQTVIPSDYWKNFKENYELYDSWWNVDDQTTNVKLLTGLTPSNGIEVDPSSVYPKGVYVITNENNVFHAHYKKTGGYEKFGITWQTWAYPSNCENDNWQLVNPINGEPWGEGADCHRTAKGYSVDFSDPANRIVSFKFQAISDNSVNLRVDLCDIKGRKTTTDALCTDGLSKTGVYDSDPESRSWNDFSVIFADPENYDDEWEDEKLEEMWYNGVFYNNSAPKVLADGHNTWWNGIDMTAPNFDVRLDSSKIVGLEFYINCDVTTAGQEADLYIKDLVIGNSLTSSEPATEYKTAVETLYSAKDVEIVDGIVYAEGKIYVVDILGQRVKFGKNQLDINDLPTGVYFIQTADGVSKIVK